MELPEQDRQALIEAARRRGVTGKGGAAFGVMPSSGKRAEKLNASRDVNMPAQLARGWAAGTLGLPGDIESLGRLGINLVKPGAVAEESFLPTSEFYQEYLPGGDERPAAKFASGLGALGGGMGSTTLARGAVKGSKAVGKAIAPKVGEMAQQYMHASGLAPQLTAYHGTPHKFAPEEGAPLGKFKSEKIGTGEGAQAYGHGIYFAESPGVAEDYRNVLGSPRNMVAKGRGVYIEPSPMGDGKYMLATRSETGKMVGTAGDATQFIYPDKTFNSLADAMRFAKKKGLIAKEARPQLVAINEDGKYVPIKKAADVEEPQYSQFIAADKGSLYTVDIPDEMIPRMLDWDKPLSQQPEVMEALKNVEGVQYADKYFKANKKADPTGEDIHEFLRLSGYNPNQIAPAMRDAGIPGVRYLDAASRGSFKVQNTYKGKPYGEPVSFKTEEQAKQYAAEQIEKGFGADIQEGTRNFVVFPGEEEKVKILERKAEGGAVKYAEGGAVSSEDLSKPSFRYPSSGRRPEKLNVSRDVNAPVQLARGWAAGLLGLPGDIEGLVRMLPGIKNETPVLPTSDFYREYLPGYDPAPAARAISGLGALAGGAGATKVAGAGVKGAKAAGKALGPKAAEMAEGYLQRSGLAPAVVPYRDTIPELEAQAKMLAGQMRARAKADRSAGLDQISDETLLKNREDSDRIHKLMVQVEELKRPQVKASEEKPDPSWMDGLPDAQRKTVKSFDEWQGDRGFSLRKPGSNPEDDLHTSAQSNFTDYEVVPKVRSIPLDALGGLGGYDSPKELARIENLAQQIEGNKEITPIFVGVDATGVPYVIEGQHRARAFKNLGMQSIPAKVIVDMTPEIGRAEGGLVTDTDAIAAKLKATGMDDEKAFMQALRMADARQEAHMALGGLAKLGKGAKAAEEATKVAKPAKAAAKTEDVAKVAKPAKAEAPKPVAGPQAKALETARKNAVKAGMSPDPKTRMLQLGFGPDWYHGSSGDIKAFRPDYLGESTGAQSAKKAYFFARDPQNPPPEMLEKAPASSESVQLLKSLGIPDEEIAKLNEVSMKGHGAETASGYSAMGGSRQYKEAMRKTNAAERAGNWDEYHKWMQIAEDTEIGRSQDLQRRVAEYGEKRDVMLDRINNALLSKPLPQEEATALDAKMKQLMPYGWYNSYSLPQLESLKGELVRLAGPDAAPALKSIDDFMSVKANRMLEETYEEGSNVMPVALRYKNPMVHDYGGSSYRDESYSDLIDQAQALGHDALILKNTFDPGRGPAKLVDVAAVFKPEQVRSRFAAFDPARINENDLLGAADPALLAGVAVGSGLGLDAIRRIKKEEQKPEEQKKARGGLAKRV
jgi:hypothetical protein